MKAEQQNVNTENQGLETAHTLSAVGAEGKFDLSKLGETITSFLKEKSRRLGIDYLGQLQRHFVSQASGKMVRTEFDKAVSEIIDAVNAFDRVPCDHIRIAPISRLEEFEQLPVWRHIAEQSIVNGEIAFEAFYAGAGERMGGPLYPLDPWAVIEKYLRESCELPSHFLPAGAIRGIGLGSRQLLQLRLSLEELSRWLHYPSFEAIGKFVIILHVNPEVEPHVRQDLIQHQHYGFEPGNMIIVPQPFLPGWHFDAQGQFVLDPTSTLFPYNHGWARMQLNWKRQAYWLDDAGQKHPFAEPVVDHLLERGIRYLTLNRINDLDRISPQGIMDVNLIALSLYLMRERGYSLTVELGGNDTGQKGGFGLAEEGSEAMFLVETLCAKSTPFVRRMDRLTEEFKNTLSWRSEDEKKNSKIGVPYNAMRQFEDIQATKDSLQEGLPVVLRYREGRIYLEPPVGDMTNLPGIRARAVMRMHDRFNPAIRNGELIYDFKELENAHKGPFFLEAQDNQPQFRELVHTLALNRSVNR